MFSKPRKSSPKSGEKSMWQYTKARHWLEKEESRKNTVNEFNNTFSTICDIKKNKKNN